MATKSIDPRFYTVFGRALGDQAYRDRLMGEDETERRSAFEEVFGARITPTQVETLNEAVQYLRNLEQEFGGDIRPCT